MRHVLVPLLNEEKRRNIGGQSMQAQGVIFGQITAVFGIVIAGVWTATQWTPALAASRSRCRSPALFAPATRRSTSARRNSGSSTVCPLAPNAGTPCFPPSCKPRIPNSACARTRWESTSMACRGAANWILPKEPSHECTFPSIRLAGDPACLDCSVLGLRLAGQAAAVHLAR